MITSDIIKCNKVFGCSPLLWAAIVLVVTKKDFLAFRIPPELKNEIQKIADGEARSISQVCELLLAEGVEAYKRDGPRFMQRLVAKHKASRK